MSDSQITPEEILLADDALRRLLPRTFLVCPDDLIEDPTNANEMSDADFAALCLSIETVGFLQPVLVVLRDGKWHIVDGQHRKRAAQAKGMKLISAINWDGTDEMLKVVQLGMNCIRGDLNLTKVSEELAKLVNEMGWTAEQLKITGFSEGELESLLASTTSPDFGDGGMPPGEGNPTPTEPAAPAAPTTTLEIEFLDAKDQKKAKRRLRRIAKQIGKDDDMGAALLHLLEEQE